VDKTIKENAINQFPIINHTNWFKKL